MKGLLIAEKPSLMRDIQEVYKSMSYKDELDFLAFRGHLLELKQPHEYDEKYQKWNIDDLPIVPKKFEYVPKKETYKVFKEIKEAIESGKYDYLINACDAGREGELIFYSFYKTINCKLPVKRLWISDTTAETIKKGLENLIDDKEMENLKKSAENRAIFDWLIGINLSRAMSLKTNTLIPIGRVMTPTLKIVVDRELEILNFVPKDYYELEIEYDNFKGIWIDKNNDTKIFDKKKLEEIKNKVSKTKEGTIISVEEKKEVNYAPTLHSLLELQKEANKVYGYTAEKTLEIAQSLYETKKLLTYPRTESRYLPKSIAKEIKQHLLSLQNIDEVKNVVVNIIKDDKKIEDVMKSKKYVDDGKVTDHHAIIPTKVKPDLSKLSKDELNIYMLVVKRFLSIFMPPNIVNKTTIITDVNGEKFKTIGKVEIQRGYLELYQKTKEENNDELPKVKKGEKVQIKKVNTLTKQTTPPPRYDDATLLQAMQNAGKFVEEEELKNILKETAGLGTSATRAEIISKLVEKNMIKRKGKSLYATQFGIKVIEVLGNREITSPELTARWETKLQSIEEGKLDSNQFYKEMIEYVNEVVNDIKNNVNEKISNKEILGKCPRCGADVIEGKSYYLCVNYKKTCDFILNKEINKTKITTNDITKLLETGSTGVKTFTSKENKQYKGRLVINNEKRVGIVFENTTKEVGKCPKCGEEIVEKDNYYICKNYKKTCDVIFNKELNGAKITSSDIKNLLKGNSIEKEFTWKSGKKSKNTLIIEEGKYKILFENNTEKKKETSEKNEVVLGKCPKCGSDVIVGNNFYVCKNYPNNCEFNISKIIKGGKISEKDAKLLIEGKETGWINFIWNNGKTGKAKLIYKENKLEFIFDNNTSS